MADPFGEDFLQKITDVHFGGGPWLQLQAFYNSTDGVNFEVDFPQQAGGTPGFIWLSGGSLPGNFVNAPFGGAGVKVQAPFLTRKLKLGAGGQSITGWGTRNQVLATSAGSLLFMQAGTGIIPNKKSFRLRLRLQLTIHGNSVLVNIGFVTKDSMRAGATTILPMTPTQGFVELGGGVAFLDVTCDPINLTVNND